MISDLMKPRASYATVLTGKSLKMGNLLILTFFRYCENIVIRTMVLKTEEQNFGI